MNTQEETTQQPFDARDAKGRSTQAPGRPSVGLRGKPSTKGEIGPRANPAPIENESNGPLPEWWERLINEVLGTTGEARAGRQG
jgi:hypothetical protein